MISFGQFSCRKPLGHERKQGKADSANYIIESLYFSATDFLFTLQDYYQTGYEPKLRDERQH